MSAAVELDNKCRAGTVEVSNIISECLLTLKSNGVFIQKIIPELSFVASHIPTQNFRDRNILALVFFQLFNLDHRGFPNGGSLIAHHIDYGSSNVREAVIAVDEFVVVAVEIIVDIAGNGV